MKHNLLLIVIAIIVPLTIKANHILGGEIGYRYKSSNGHRHTYTVTLSFFADCGSPGPSFSDLVNATPRVALYKKDQRVQSLLLHYQAGRSDVEITPVCPDEKDRTTCKQVGNPLPGVKLYVYEADFILQGSESLWRFIFEGEISAISVAGRTPLINNANVMGGASLMYLEALLDNTKRQNSTPLFTATPTPFFCVHQLQRYNMGAIDPDGNQLKYHLIPAKDHIIPNLFPSFNLFYFPPFTALQPLPALGGTFSFNDQTGQLNFNPDRLINSVVVIQVAEYENGEWQGASMREMAFVILDNCANRVPGSTLTHSSGAQQDAVDPSVWHTCVGSRDSLRLRFSASDPDGDNLDISLEQLPFGFIATIENNNTTKPTVVLSGSLHQLPAGKYTFYLRMKDDGCPIFVEQTEAFTLWVHPSTNPVDSVLICAGDQYDFYGQAISKPGYYDQMFTSFLGCDSQRNVWLVVDPLPLVRLQQEDLPLPIIICAGEFTELNVLQPKEGQRYYWYRDDVLLEDIKGPQLTIDNEGVYHVVVENASGCRDSSLKLPVLLLPNPEPKIAIEPDTILCIGARCRFSAIPQMSNYIYQWSPLDRFRAQVSLGQFEITAILSKKEEYIVLQVTDTSGCKGWDSLKVWATPCCTIFMPNAFSPNGDGYNDKIAPVLHPGQSMVAFRIFNRWGELVFERTHNLYGWDGLTPDRRLAQGDTYMYQVVYDCNGSLYENKGDFILLR